MDRFFRDQVGMFAPPKPPADFPLVVMTCVGVETLGAYKYGDLGRQSVKGPKKVARDRHFQRIIEDIDQGFNDAAIAPDRRNRPLSDFVFEGFRHSLVHGFYGKWVFIAGDQETMSWFYDPAEMCVVINTYWFYRRFCDIYDQYFEDLLACPAPTTEPLRTFDQTFCTYWSRWL
jgi:hypothetical protein